MTAEEKAVGEAKLKKILDVLAAGSTVYIQTHLKCWKVTQKHVDGWAKAGHPFFKSSGKSVYMARGKKNYDCIDHCKFTVES